MDKSIRESGNIVKKMAKGFSCTLRAISILASLGEINWRESESLFGKMGLSMKESLGQARYTAPECGEAVKTNPM